MKRPLQLPLAIALALGATNALALGLGPVHVKSRLNQPLDAEIPVIEGNAHDADGLLVTLAGADEFERVGLSRSRLAVPLDFAVVKNAQGALVIKVTSKEPVRAAYLDFLVEANWTRGRLLREYTVLLDPPLTAPAAGHATTTALTESPAPVTVAKNTKPAPQAAPSAAETPRAVAKAPPPAAVAKIKQGEYGPVGAGETLSEVARATREGTGASVNQMMLALLKSNPNAFYKDNINALKRGAILRVPAADEIKAAGNAAEAAAQVHAQIEDWRGGRAAPSQIAAATAHTPASVSTSKPSKSAAVASKEAAERLELVPPRAGKDSIAMADKPGHGAGSAAATGELKSELARTKEALTAREQEAGELKSKVKELEGLNGKNDRLINLKDSEIADLQQKLRELQTKAAASATKPATAAVSTPPAATPVKPAETVPALATATPANAPATGKAHEAAKSPVAEPPKTSGEAAKTAPALATSTPAPHAAESHDMTPHAPADGADVTNGHGSTPTTAVPASTTPAPAVPGAAAPHPADVTPLAAGPTKPAPKPVTPSSKPAVAKPAPAAAQPWFEQAWVKPVALGAGILLLLGGLIGLRKRKPAPSPARTSIADAFGDSPLHREGDAADSVAAEEASLREQLELDPGNVGLHLELLSLYYAERDVAKFEEQAAQMHAFVSDPHSPEWEEAEAMGQELAPHNPLFAHAGHEAEAFAFAPEHAFDDVPTFEASGAAHAVSHAEMADVFSPEHAAVSHAEVADEMHDFTFENLPPLAPEVAPPHLAEAEVEHAHTPAAMPFDDIGDDAIGTKLDLAKAYMDLGDPEGARSMLEEVFAEGNEAQKAEADRLMAEIR